MGRRGIKGLKARMGWECSISREEPDGPVSRFNKIFVLSQSLSYFLKLKRFVVSLE